jgi:glycosyltransferase involved in cell wall biosynthesis
VRFSIITPSYRSSAWLPLCIASVADQGVEVEHLVQDAGSDDGTLDWLPGDRRVRAVVEKDAGMYDAINRGLRRSGGDILAYLNCDEQYLPGALASVARYFESHPDSEVVFGDVIMVDAKGEYVFHRKMQAPLKYHTWMCHLSTLSCAMFFRRSIVSERGLLFDDRWRDAGDAEWMLRLMRGGVRMGTLRRFTSTFTVTGTNMSIQANARRENRELRQTAPGLARALRPGIILHHRLRRLLGGMYWQAPFSYEIYCQASPERRKSFQAPRPRLRPS